MRESVKEMIRRSRVLVGLVRLLRTRQVALLDYRFDSRPRYGHGLSPHGGLNALLGERREAYARTLRGFLPLVEPLARINVDEPESSPEPRWRNGYLPALDAVALYGLLATRRPNLFLEIGSGNSTTFARRAIRDHALPTRVVSIDPHPRREIDALCDEVIRAPLEKADPAVFARLQPGDVLFMDGSHRCFMNSDATVFFLEILPNLRPGVMVQIHDIVLPFDYPPDWAPRYYSEQYLLACYLLARTRLFEPLLPNAFIRADAGLHGILNPLWSHARLAGVETHGVSFWLTMGDAAAEHEEPPGGASVDNAP